MVQLDKAFTIFNFNTCFIACGRCVTDSGGLQEEGIALEKKYWFLEEYG